MYFISFSLEKFSLLSLILVALLPPFLCGVQVRQGKGMDAGPSPKVGVEGNFPKCGWGSPLSLSPAEAPPPLPAGYAQLATADGFGACDHPRHWLLWLGWWPPVEGSFMSPSADLGLLPCFKGL